MFGVINEAALRHPCDAALSLFLAPHSSGTILYLLDPIADPQCVLPRRRTARAFVQSIDTSAQSTRAETPRAVDLGAPIAADPIALPFADASINIAIVQLASSWPASAAGERKLISELRRILAPSGEILVLAKKGHHQNRRRTARSGERDKQSRVARLFRRAFALLILVSTLPNTRSLEAALTRSGFKSREWFVPLRGGDGCLREVRPLVAQSSVWNTYASPGLGQLIRHSRWFAEEFVVRASVHDLGPSVLERCLESAASGTAGNASSASYVGIQHLLVTGKEKLVALTVLNGTRTVLRIPLSESALKGCQRNLRALRALEQAGRTKLAPLPIIAGHAAGHYYAVESRVSGHPMRRLPRAASDLALIESVIRQLHPKATLRRVDDQLFEQLVCAPLRRVATAAGGLHSAQAVELFFSSRLRGKQIPMGITHGDLSLRNVFVSSGEIAGVIDWDDSSLTGIPLLDAISHLCSRQFRRSANFPGTFVSLAARLWPAPEELSFLDRCYEHFGTDASLHSALVFLYWLRLVDGQLDLRFARESAMVRCGADEISRAIVGQSVAN